MILPYRKRASGYQSSRKNTQKRQKREVKPEYKLENHLFQMKATATIEQLNAINSNTIGAHLGIEFTEIGEGYIVARMPVDQRTHQPMGLLHGGASVVLAETLGSVASFVMIDDHTNYHAVGLEINANHLRGVRSGWVYGRVTPIHVGKTTHVWDIRITDEQGKAVCVSRLTCAVIAARH